MTNLVSQDAHPVSRMVIHIEMMENVMTIAF